MKKIRADRGSGVTPEIWNRLRIFLPLGLALGGWQAARGENQLDYRYEYYAEESDRMTINTHSVYFEQQLIDAILAKGEMVYDAVSGATPTGTHDWSLVAGGFVKGNAKIQPIDSDLRLAANFELDCRLGNHTLTPGFAWSQEHDYLSYGLSLNDAIEFNDKNTILQLGVSHNFDSVRHSDKVTWSGKDSTEVIIGLSQLLSPKDVFSAAITVGNDSGYLSDPYRLAEYYVTSFGFGIGVPEQRPAHRNKQIFFSSLTHHFDRLDASLEVSYRFYHDSYGVIANTVALTWHQRLGKHVIVEPLFRFSGQSAADFYSPLFSGTSSSGPTSGFYSSDYRLSKFYSLDYGLQATAIINAHLRAIAGYHRYAMTGWDGNTTSDMYPKANVFTVGVSFLW